MPSRTSYVALLRGINVGGKNKLPMADLAAMFSAAGCGGVRTYIQSGNVVFEASAKVAGALPGAVGRAIEAGFGYRVPVILRTADELGAVVRSNPFLAKGGEPEVLHVAFLSAEPGPARVAALDHGRSPPDEMAVLGREVYLRLPNGAARTKLTNAYFDSTLAATSTVRNWRTVEKLAEMAKGGGGS
jgi:uncharacterized protein (DUF1697 family)